MSSSSSSAMAVQQQSASASLAVQPAARPGGGLPLGVSVASTAGSGSATPHRLSTATSNASEGGEVAEDELSSIVWQGWLKKKTPRGPVRLWQWRWFRLLGDVLEYYKSDRVAADPEGVCSGMVPLQLMLHVKLHPRSKKDGCRFDILVEAGVGEKGRVFALLAPDAALASKLVRSLSNMIHQPPDLEQAGGGGAGAARMNLTHLDLSGEFWKRIDAIERERRRAGAGALAPHSGSNGDRLATAATGGDAGTFRAGNGGAGGPPTPSSRSRGGFGNGVNNGGGGGGSAAAAAAANAKLRARRQGVIRVGNSDQAAEAAQAARASAAAAAGGEGDNEENTTQAQRETEQLQARIDEIELPTLRILAELHPRQPLGRLYLVREQSSKQPLLMHACAREGEDAAALALAASLGPAGAAAQEGSGAYSSAEIRDMWAEMGARLQHPFLMSQLGQGECQDQLWCLYAYPHHASLQTLVAQLLVQQQDAVAFVHSIAPGLATSASASSASSPSSPPLLLPVPVVMHLCCEFLLLLAFLHQSSVVCSRFTLAHMYLSERGHVVLLDPWILDHRDGSEPRIKQKPDGYTTPEWHRSGLEDYRSDYWRLGLALYELLTGCLPAGLTRLTEPAMAQALEARATAAAAAAGGRRGGSEQIVLDDKALAHTAAQALRQGILSFDANDPAQLAFPAETPPHLADFVRKLLRVQPSRRIGGTPLRGNAKIASMAEVLSHPVFASTDFAAWDREIYGRTVGGGPLPFAPDYVLGSMIYAAAHGPGNCSSSSASNQAQQMHCQPVASVSGATNSLLSARRQEFDVEVVVRAGRDLKHVHEAGGALAGAAMASNSGSGGGGSPPTAPTGTPPTTRAVSRANTGLSRSNTGIFGSVAANSSLPPPPPKPSIFYAKAFLGGKVLKTHPVSASSSPVRPILGGGVFVARVWEWNKPLRFAGVSDALLDSALTLRVLAKDEDSFHDATIGSVVLPLRAIHAHSEAMRVRAQQQGVPSKASNGAANENENDDAWDAWFAVLGRDGFMVGEVRLSLRMLPASHRSAHLEAQLAKVLSTPFSAPRRRFAALFGPAWGAPPRSRRELEKYLLPNEHSRAEVAQHQLMLLRRTEGNLQPVPAPLGSTWDPMTSGKATDDELILPRRLMLQLVGEVGAGAGGHHGGGHGGAGGGGEDGGASVTRRKQSYAQASAAAALAARSARARERERLGLGAGRSIMEEDEDGGDHDDDDPMSSGSNSNGGGGGIMGRGADLDDEEEDEEKIAERILAAQAQRAAAAARSREKRPSIIARLAGGGGLAADSAAASSSGASSNIRRSSQTRGQSNSVPPSSASSPASPRGAAGAGGVGTTPAATGAAAALSSAMGNAAAAVGSGAAAGFLRSLVSKKKFRFQEAGFDLDLSYVGERLIAMGFPSEGSEAAYRNPLGQVQAFFKTFHPGAFRIYNLCSERKYDAAKFAEAASNGSGSCGSGSVGSCVREIGFDDHNAPAMHQMLDLCVDAAAFLRRHPDNVVAIHCKAGKGRTGTMIACLLLFLGVCLHPEAALLYFARARTSNEAGVTIPSQRRYVHYFHRYLRNWFDVNRPFPWRGRKILLTHVRMTGIPRMDMVSGGCDPSWMVFSGGRCVFDSSQYAAQTMRGGGLCSRSGGPHQVSASENGDSVTGSATTASGDALKGLSVDRVDWRCFVWLRGDIKLLFADRDRFGRRERLCWAWLNTTMISASNARHTVLHKNEIDRAIKDKECRQFPAHFKIELFYRPDNAAAAIDGDEAELDDEDDVIGSFGAPYGAGSAEAGMEGSFAPAFDEFRPAGQSTAEVDALLRAAAQEEAEAEEAEAAVLAAEAAAEGKGSAMDDVAEEAEEDDERESMASSSSGGGGRADESVRPVSQRPQPRLQAWQQPSADEAAQLLHLAAVSDYAIWQSTEEEAANTFQPGAVSVGL